MPTGCLKRCKDRAGQDYFFEIRLVSKGENHDYELTDSVFRDIHGSQEGRIIFIHDVTKRKQLEERLLDSERKHAEAILQQTEDKYQTLFKNMSVGVLYQRADGVVTDANPAAGRILGVNANQISKLNYEIANIKAVHTDGSDYLADEYPSLVSIRTGQPTRNQVMGIYFPQEKDYHWININTVPQFKPGEEQPYQVFVTFDDITDLKKREDNLHESEDKFKYVFDHSVAGKSFTLPSGELNVNQAFCNMVGYSAEELKHRKWQEITHPEDIELTNTANEALISGKKESMRFNKRFIHKNGGIVWADVSTSLRRDETGKPLYFMTIIPGYYRTQMGGKETPRERGTFPQPLRECHHWHVSDLA